MVGGVHLSNADYEINDIYDVRTFCYKKALKQFTDSVVLQNSYYTPQDLVRVLPLEINDTREMVEVIGSPAQR
jgi:hypothetical protein